MIDLSIIIVSYNSKDFILECLRSVKRWTKGITYEVIVVDNGSKDGTTELLKNGKTEKRKNIEFHLIENEKNAGFAGGNNVGIKKAKGRHVLLLNPDTKLVDNSIKKMVEWMDEHPKVGIASCKLIYEDGVVQSTGGFFPTLPRVFLWATFIDDIPFIQQIFGSYHPHTYLGFYDKERELDWVTGAFFLISRKVIDGIGLLDEDFFLYVEELEYCMRAKELGWKVGYSPQTQIIHYVGKSGTKEGTVIQELSGLKLLYKKHFSPIDQLILRVFLIVGSLVRALIFGIIDSNRGKIYARALGTI